MNYEGFDDEIVFYDKDTMFLTIAAERRRLKPRKYRNRIQDPALPDGSDRIAIAVHARIADIPWAQWDACAGDNPFVSHAFLNALEESELGLRGDPAGSRNT